jgi:hypothetical protein
MDATTTTAHYDEEIKEKAAEALQRTILEAQAKGLPPGKYATYQ